MTSLVCALYKEMMQMSLAEQGVTDLENELVKLTARVEEGWGQWHS